jgi:symplekin
MASTPFDPLSALQAALAAPANSKEQGDVLNSLRESLEKNPGPIRILVGTLMRNVVNADDSMIKRWVIELLHYGVSKAELSLDVKTQSQSVSENTPFARLTCLSAASSGFPGPRFPCPAAR